MQKLCIFASDETKVETFVKTKVEKKVQTTKKRKDKVMRASEINNARTRMVEAAGMTWKVYNKSAQRRAAIAYRIDESGKPVGKGVKIGNGQEVLDMRDTDDIEMRIMTALTPVEEQ